MSFWPDEANVIAAGASAVAAGASWYVAVRANRIADKANEAADRANQAAEAANRTAEAVARIERDRWHVELTPQFTISAMELWPNGPRAALRIDLVGPPGLPPLTEVILSVRDDGYSRQANELVGQDQLDSTIFGPYRFEPGIDGTTPDGRSAASRPLRVGEWDKFFMERTPVPAWTLHDLWEAQHGGNPVRLALECRADGHAPWYIPTEVVVSGPIEV